MEERTLGSSVLSAGGTTPVPEEAMDAMGLRLGGDGREKILWTVHGVESIVARGRPQSSFRKTMLRKNGSTAVPKHVMKAMKLSSKPGREERLLWVQRGGQVVVKKEPLRSRPTG